jgi:hypothetical protein
VKKKWVHWEKTSNIGATIPFSLHWNVEYDRRFLNSLSSLWSVYHFSFVRSRLLEIKKETFFRKPRGEKQVRWRKTRKLFYIQVLLFLFSNLFSKRISDFLKCYVKIDQIVSQNNNIKHKKNKWKEKILKVFGIFRSTSFNCW